MTPSKVVTLDNTEVASIYPRKVNADDVAAVGSGDDDGATDQISEATVNVDGFVTDDTRGTILDPECSDIDNANVADDDNHSNQDSDTDYVEFLEDVFMQVPPPEKISWSDIIERNGSDVEDDENSEYEFTAFVDTLASVEDPNVIANRVKKQAEFAGFVAFVQTPDTLANTDFLPPSEEDDVNSVEKAWEEIVSGMAEPEAVEAAPLLSWALSWFNPAAWSQPQEVTLEKNVKEVGPVDECMSETDCASETSSQAIMQMQMV